MAGHVDAIGAVQGNMGTEPLHLSNPGSIPGEGQGLSLSAIAEQALGSIGSLQDGFSQGVTPSQSPGQAIDNIQRTGAGEGVHPQQTDMNSVALMEQIQASTNVQTQLVRFVTASSISSSLGRNLNMFLRGQ